MNDPLAELRSALDDEPADGPRIASMATVDAGGRPHVRSVVCRKIGPETLWIASDARSDKNGQVRANPAVELAFWLPRRREQFRVAGKVEFPGSEDREEAWSAMSDSARALFAWPDPGRPREPSPEAFPRSIQADAPVPETFELLAVVVDQVEHLDLTRHPHRRRRWRAEAGWRAEELNP